MLNGKCSILLRFMVVGEGNVRCVSRHISILSDHTLEAMFVLHGIFFWDYLDFLSSYRLSSLS